MSDIRCSAWHAGPFGVYVVFDTLDEAERVRDAQPLDEAVGLTRDFYRLTECSDGFEVRIHAKMLKHYTSDRMALSI